MSLATSEGRPKIPLPIIELMTSAAKAGPPSNGAHQSGLFRLPGKRWLYHSRAAIQRDQLRQNVGASV